MHGGHQGGRDPVLRGDLARGGELVASPGPAASWQSSPRAPSARRRPRAATGGDEAKFAFVVPTGMLDVVGALRLLDDADSPAPLDDDERAHDAAPRRRGGAAARALGAPSPSPPPSSPVARADAVADWVRIRRARARATGRRGVAAGRATLRGGSTPTKSGKRSGSRQPYARAFAIARAAIAASCLGVMRRLGPRLRRPRR